MDRRLAPALAWLFLLLGLFRGRGFRFKIPKCGYGMVVGATRGPPQRVLVPTIRCLSALFISLAFMLLAACGGGGGGGAPAPTPQPTPVTVSASVNKTNANINEPVELTCDTTGEINALEARCHNDDPWQAYNNPLECVYPGTGTNSPGCRANQNVTDTKQVQIVDGATVGASVDKPDVLVNEEVGLTCATDGVVVSVEARCAEDYAWIDYSDDFTCSYSAEGTFEAGCRVNDNATDTAAVVVSQPLQINNSCFVDESVAHGNNWQKNLEGCSNKDGVTWSVNKPEIIVDGYSATAANVVSDIDDVVFTVTKGAESVDSNAFNITVTDIPSFVLRMSFTDPVNANASISGLDVVVTNGEQEFNAVSDINGEVEIDLLNAGTFSIYVDDDDIPYDISNPDDSALGDWFAWKLDDYSINSDLSLVVQMLPVVESDFGDYRNFLGFFLGMTSFFESSKQEHEIRISKWHEYPVCTYVKCAGGNCPSGSPVYEDFVNKHGVNYSEEMRWVLSRIENLTGLNLFYEPDNFSDCVDNNRFWGIIFNYTDTYSHADWATDSEGYYIGGMPFVANDCPNTEPEALRMLRGPGIHELIHAGLGLKNNSARGIDIMYHARDPPGPSDEEIKAITAIYYFNTTNPIGKYVED